MKCDEFELLLPDAVGNELPAEDRAAFEAHANECAKCRRELDSLRATVGDVRSLPAPRALRVERVGEMLVIGEGTRASRRPWMHTALRYAASVLIAFVAGYSAHSALRGSNPMESFPHRGGATLQVALAEAHARNPEKSDFAKGLIAVFETSARR